MANNYLKEYKRNLNAFAEMAKMIHPNVAIKKAVQMTEVDENGTDVICVITFEDGYVVTRNQDGSDIIVLNPNGEITHSVWYWAFNWQGLMATSKEIF